VRIFYDTEFHEDGKIIDLISIAMVAEDGREYYAVNLQHDWARTTQHNDWVVQNVLPYMAEDNVIPWKTEDQIRDDILNFVGNDKPEWWGWYSAYDHVALMQLWGPMATIPKGWPYFTRDIKQYCDQLDNPELPKQSSIQHNALHDARWNRNVWNCLHDYESRMGE
jgi:hypothetical protein